MLEFDPFTLDSEGDRYAVFRRLRSSAHVMKGPAPFPPYQSGTYLLGMDVVDRALKHPALMHAPPGAHQATYMPGPDDLAWGQMTRWMLLSDPPRHGLLRRPLAGIFSESSVARLQQQMRSVATGLVTAAVSKGDFDLIQDFTVPFA